MTALPICRSLGICFGCAIGAALDNISVGVAMGLGIGSLVGGAISLISTMKTKNINKVDREKKENQEETK